MFIYFTKKEKQGFRLEGLKQIVNANQREITGEENAVKGLKQREGDQSSLQLNLKCCPQDERFLLLMEK